MSSEVPEPERRRMAVSERDRAGRVHRSSLTIVPNGCDWLPVVGVRQQKSASLTRLWASSKRITAPFSAMLCAFRVWKAEVKGRGNVVRREQWVESAQTFIWESDVPRPKNKVKLRSQHQDNSLGVTASLPSPYWSESRRPRPIRDKLRCSPEDPAGSCTAWRWCPPAVLRPATGSKDTPCKTVERFHTANTMQNTSKKTHVFNAHIVTVQYKVQVPGSVKIKRQSLKL